MRLLYSGLDGLLTKAQELVPKLAEYPIISDLNTTMIYLGPVTDLAQVEIKKDKTTKGWMYNTNSIVFFHYNEELYEVFISTLRDFALEKFAAKKLVKPDEDIGDGIMVRFPDARITGYVAVEDLVAVSHKIEK